jgi:hypothetical protein
MKSFELMNLTWIKMDNIYNYSNNISALVYAFAWCDNKPSATTWPFMLQDTFYIGMSGGLKDDFTGDKKNPNKSKVTPTTAIHRRMKEHKRKFSNIKANFGSEKRKYELYHKIFDKFTTHEKTLYVALMIPKTHVKSVVKRNVISMVESEQIYEFANLFDNPPVLNLAESFDVSDVKKIEDSHSQKMMRRIEEQNITRFMC